MADIRVRITASGENLTRVTAELLALLATDARVDARPAPVAAPPDSKSGTGTSVGELVVADLSAASVRRMASVLTEWTRSSERTVLVEVDGDELVVEAGSARTIVEKWLRDRG